MTGKRFLRGLAAAGALAAPVFLAACGTATIEDAVPVSATAQPAAATGASLAAVTFSRPGDYPNLNVIPQPAAAQITEAKREADTTMLRAIREQQQADGRGRGAAGTAGELRRIGRSHATDALKEIQGQ